MSWAERNLSNVKRENPMPSPNPMRLNEELYVDGTGQHIIVHEKGEGCKERCVIHNPSTHAMSNFRTHWRGDRGIMERICEHGVGHPDPDGIEYIRQTRGREAADVESVHGCDGCCVAPQEWEDMLRAYEERHGPS